MAAANSLRAAVTPRIEIERVGRVRYDRTHAVVWFSKANQAAGSFNAGKLSITPNGTTAAGSLERVKVLPAERSGR